MVSKIIYEVPDFKPDFEGEAEFNGIKMKKQDDVLYFYRKDLQEKGIIE